MNSIAEAIGNTPLVRLNRVPQSEGILCEVLAKCEFLNPGGSIKDRVAKQLFQDAEESGRMRAGERVVEATSGNAGIGMAMMAAAKGYKMTTCIPEKMVGEKTRLLKALGSGIIVTSSGAHTLEEGSHYMTAKRIGAMEADTHFLDQYNNPGNPLCHYDGTAQEIFEQCGGRVDYLFICGGTGGTLTGVGRKFRLISPQTKIIGVDAFGSLLSPADSSEQQDSKRLVEGLGKDFVPKSMDHTVVDDWVRNTDAESFRLTKELISKEGFLCGSSSGACLQGLIKYLRRKGLANDPGLRCVIICPDTIRNYLTKFCSEEWMYQQGFVDHSEIADPSSSLYGKTCEDLLLSPIPSLSSNSTMDEFYSLIVSGHKFVQVQETSGNYLISSDMFLESSIKKGYRNICLSDIKIQNPILVASQCDLTAVFALLQRFHSVFFYRECERPQTKELYVITPDSLLHALTSQFNF